MMRMIWSDLRRIFASGRFWLCVGACVTFAGISLGINLSHYPVLWRRAGALTMFLHATALAYGGVFDAAAPLLCTPPFALAYMRDMGTRNLQYIITRMRPAKYFAARACSTAVSGGSVFLMANTLFLLACLCLSQQPSFRIEPYPHIACAASMTPLSCSI